MNKFKAKVNVQDKQQDKLVPKPENVDLEKAPFAKTKFYKFVFWPSHV